MKKELVLLERGKPIVHKDIGKVVEAIESEKANIFYMVYELCQLCEEEKRMEESISFLFENVFKNMKVEIIEPLPQTEEIGRTPVLIRKISGYDVLFFEEEKGFTVICPSLSGCITEGDTVEEATRNVKEAIKGYLKCARKYGVRVRHPIRGTRQS